MRPGVVDTNVLRVADDALGEWQPEHVSACMEYLLALQRRGSIVVDDADRILSEYKRTVGTRARRQLGVGGQFLLWLYQIRADQRRCEAVTLTPLGDDPRQFDEFPADSDLKAFDADDRKFVATALGSCREPEVVNATDSDWWEHREALARNGVRVRFLCPTLFQQGG